MTLSWTVDFALPIRLAHAQDPSAVAGDAVAAADMTLRAALGRSDLGEALHIIDALVVAHPNDTVVRAWALGAYDSFDEAAIQVVNTTVETLVGRGEYDAAASALAKFAEVRASSPKVLRWTLDKAKSIEQRLSSNASTVPPVYSASADAAACGRAWQACESACTESECSHGVRICLDACFSQNRLSLQACLPLLPSPDARCGRSPSQGERDRRAGGWRD